MIVTIEEKLRVVACFVNEDKTMYSDTSVWIPSDICQEQPDSEAVLFNVCDLKFHKDYNWLMGAWREWYRQEKPEGITKDKWIDARNLYWGFFHSELLRTINPTAPFDAIYSAILFLNSLKETK